ncbi:protein Star [Euwallacea fornicatus]|uniref:protein Star n=1 Tax=Euwallacea fornicatus TaxID=995702 RepID=UPI00338EB74E
MTASSNICNTPYPPPLAQQNGLPTTLPSSMKCLDDTDSHNRILTRRLLPIALFFVAFATVMSVLILYMDNTAMKHHQFTLSLSKDMELNGIAQDDPQLIMYLREVALFPAIEPHQKSFEVQEPTFADTEFVLKLLNFKKNGIFVEAGAYSDGKTSKTEVLERKFNWKGLLIQPDPRHYFNLRRHNRAKSQCVHACLSPMPYPREVTLHNENDVKINDIRSNSIDNPDWLVIRVKCFPLYSLLLAMNSSNVDYLSLATDGTELQVLETLPFDRVKIEIIGVDLSENDSDIGIIKKFLASKKYQFMDKFNGTYIFMMNRVKI